MFLIDLNPLNRSKCLKMYIIIIFIIIIRYLEHQTLTAGDVKKVGSTLPVVSKDRMKRVMGMLGRMKDTVNSKAIKHLKETMAMAKTGEYAQNLKVLI